MENLTMNSELDQNTDATQASPEASSLAEGPQVQTENAVTPPQPTSIPEFIQGVLPIGALMLIDSDSVQEALSNGDLDSLKSMASSAGLDIKPETMSMLISLGSASGDLARAASKLASAMPGLYAEAQASGDFSETFVKGVIGQLAEFVNDGILSSDTFSKVLEYTMGEYGPLISKVLRDGSEKAVNALMNVVINKLTIGAGKSGYDEVLSYTLSILYSLLPDWAKGAFRGALMGISAGKGVLDDKAQLVTDAITSILNALGVNKASGGFAPLAEPQWRTIQGTKWWFIPYSFGYVGVADSPVVGPDVRIFWNKWSPATKQAFKVLDLIPYVGDTIVELFECQASQQAYEAFYKSIENSTMAGDTLQTVLKTTLNVVKRTLVQRGASYVDKLLFKISGWVNGKARDIVERIQNLAPAEVYPHEGEIQSTGMGSLVDRETLPHATADLLSSLTADSVSESGLRKVHSSVDENAQADTMGVEPWYIGQDGHSPGSKAG